MSPAADSTALGCIQQYYQTPKYQLSGSPYHRELTWNFLPKNCPNFPCKHYALWERSHVNNHSEVLWRAKRKKIVSKAKFYRQERTVAVWSLFKQVRKKRKQRCKWTFQQNMQKKWTNEGNFQMSSKSWPRQKIYFLIICSKTISLSTEQSFNAPYIGFNVF